MKPITKKKLALAPETLRTLASGQLAHVNGGAGTTTVVTTRLNSQDTVCVTIRGCR
jgi:hypothetical protein